MTVADYVSLIPGLNSGHGLRSDERFSLQFLALPLSESVEIIPCHTYSLSVLLSSVRVWGYCLWGYCLWGYCLYCFYTLICHLNGKVVTEIRPNDLFLGLPMQGACTLGLCLSMRGPPGSAGSAGKNGRVWRKPFSLNEKA